MQAQRTIEGHTRKGRSALAVELSRRFGWAPVTNRRIGEQDVYDVDTTHRCEYQLGLDPQLPSADVLELIEDHDVIEEMRRHPRERVVLLAQDGAARMAIWPRR